jgi:hypothetical protein
MRHGSGVETWESGDKYEGLWKDDRYDGHGALKTRGGKYDGNFVGGLKHGKGTMKFNNGAMYSGHWAKGRMHGKGTSMLCVNFV